ncbi:MAG: hypothetical protein NWE76_08330 [Candidatus Bathyarchaeota archaeon]|nr:hypothetical protein [Candidatus Bathyarchaeota archaeon]
MSDKKQVHPLLPLGVGVAIGGSALWLAIELWPVLVLGGAAWLITKGAAKSNLDKAGATNEDVGTLRDPPPAG